MGDEIYTSNSNRKSFPWELKYIFSFQVFIIISLIGINKMFASALGLFGNTHRTEKLMSGVSVINI